MRLSLDKKRGMTRVRGGRLLRVTRTHRVDTCTWSTLSLSYERNLDGSEKETEPPFGDRDHVFALPGDLAIEIVKHGFGGKVFGVSYLSGGAIQLNRYDAPESDWFTEVHGGVFDVPKSPPRSDDEVKDMIERVLAIKYGDADVVAVDTRQESAEAAKGLCEFLSYAWSLAPRDTPESKYADTSVHLVGRVRHPGGDIMIHFQPPKDKSDYAMTGFQQALVMRAARACAKRRTRK